MPAQQRVTIPFVGAAHAYRRLYDTESRLIDTSTHDVSPPGNKIFAYGYLRSHLIYVTASGAASSGGTYSADGVYGLINNIAIRQPGGQEMYGGPNFGGFHAYLANKNSGWKYGNDPSELPSYSSSVTSPSFTLRQVFEINAQTGLGSLPNQNDAAPWQIQVTANNAAGAYTTAPTTTNPTLKFQYFIEAWTVPSPQNPLRPQIAQITAPPLLGTLNKWTVQQLVVPGGSSFDAQLIRKGNSLRNLGLIAYSSTPARIAVSNFPNPITVEWDGTVLRANDVPNLWLDDEFMVRGGAVAATSQTPETGVIWLKFGDPAGIDVSALGLDGLGMVKQWGTTQTSTITFGGAWGASVASINFLTNDVQYVIPSPNPYALAAGQPYLANAVQPSAVG